MKRSLYVLAAMALGVIVAIAATGALIAYIPNCGEDCANAAINIFAACVVIAIVIFGASALLLSRQGIPPWHKSLCVAAVLIAVILVPAFSHYIYYG